MAVARGYATAGWRVFVLGRSKRPVANCQPCKAVAPDHDHDREVCDCLTCHGFYAATTDPTRIAAMLAAIPDGLVAIRTGATSGLVIVDIDPAHGGELDRALMTPTATVATGGGGWHLYYTHPGKPVPSRPLPGHPGVDIKADGGYVVAPPSIHPATRRPYRWAGGRAVGEMPPPLLEVCLSQPDPPTPAPAAPHPAPPASPAGQGGGGISHPDLLLAAHLAAVARAPQGRRRTTLYGAARGAARMVAADALTCRAALDALTRAGLAAGQTARETRAAIEGGFRDEAVAIQP
ncbi:bifunctional DNA primase/polymerase [Pseudofrankia sp. BMG5.36]|uniref:bifunctional DNA primase/polymerase n=1 Tax=Pseudofrankia sp. BMG5.36 TaxID=1834512 RepID=UPI0008DB2CF4|nr:DNA primase [Pseudofrankia sp. BMG5.36]